MSEESAFTVRVKLKRLKTLDKLALRLERSRNYLVNQAIDNFLDVQEWQIQKTEEGIKAADKGDFISDKKMESIINKYRA